MLNSSRFLQTFEIFKSQVITQFEYILSCMILKKERKIEKNTLKIYDILIYFPRAYIYHEYIEHLDLQINQKN